MNRLLILALAVVVALAISRQRLLNDIGNPS